jgi:plasmid stabilization system protein ParE
MKHRVVWSEWSRQDLLAIKKYWDLRNQSNTYSQGLIQAFKDRAKLIETHPHISRPTDFEGVRSVLVSNYIMLFEAYESDILIIMIWDARRDPEDLEMSLNRRLSGRE